MEIWDAGQLGEKGWKEVGVGGALVNVYTCLITEVENCIIIVYRSLIEVKQLKICLLKPIALLRVLGSC